MKLECILIRGRTARQKRRSALPILSTCAVFILLLAQFGLARGPRVAQPAGGDSFYPVAVWYGGGKARAPMLERVDTTSPERWGKDLDQIKAVGFNTVKCWVDWATAEPKPGEFEFQNLDL